MIIPKNTPFGADPITATGQASGLIGSASVYVANDDPQFGYNAQHTGAEVGRQRHPQLPVREQHHQGHAAMECPRQRCLRHHPGDQPGSGLHRRRSRHAFRLCGDQWRHPLHCGTGVADRVVSRGGRRGGVRRGRRGRPLGLQCHHRCRPLDGRSRGKVPTPTVSNGTVYVGSAAGDVVAINEVTGAVKWTASLGSAVSSAPAIDPALGNVIATTQSGVVEALSPVNGTTLWSDSVGGALTEPMIYGGNVFVGSSTGAFDAKNAKTGASAWSVNAGAAISVPPIITAGNFATVATAAQYRVLLRRLHRCAHFHAPLAQLPITGLTCTGSIVLVTSTGRSPADRCPTKCVHRVALQWQWDSGLSGSGGVLERRSVRSRRGRDVARLLHPREGIA